MIKRSASFLILIILAINIHQAYSNKCTFTNAATSGCSTCDSNNVCIACTDTTQNVNLAGNKCVTSCDTGSTANGNKICVCPTGQVKNLNADGCTANTCAATAGQALNLKKDQCVANTVAACGTNTKVTGSTCLCDDGSNYYLNSDYTCKTTCDATWPFMSYTTPNTCSVDCGANKQQDGTPKKCFNAATCTDKLFIDGKTCLTDCTRSSSGAITDSGDATKCACDTGTPYKYLLDSTPKCVSACPSQSYIPESTVTDKSCVSTCPNYIKSDSTACLATCDGTNKANLGNKKCVGTQPTGSSTDANGNYACTGAGKYWVSDFSACTTDCLNGTTQEFFPETGNICVTSCPNYSNGNQCVASCPGTGTAANIKIQIDKKCSATCTITGTDDSVTSNVCACPLGQKINAAKNGCDTCSGGTPYVSADQTSCVADCPSTIGNLQFLSVDSKYCIKSACPSSVQIGKQGTCACGGSTILSTDGKSCICPTSKPYWIDSTKADCTATCTGTNDTINLAGDTCIQSTSCPSSSTTATTNGQKSCSCTKDSTNIYKDSTNSNCIATCPGGQVINLKGDGCMTTAACAAAGSGSDYSADTTNGYCICSDSTKYLASDAQTCVANCYQKNEVISFNNKRKSCVLQSQCTSMNGTVRSNSLVNSNVPSCYCSLSNPLKSSNLLKCVSDCSSSTEYRNLKQDMCQLQTDTTNCPSQATVTGRTAKDCTCGGGNVIKADRTSCVASSTCTFLNSDQTMCVNNCQGELQELKSGNKCVKLNTSTGISTLDGLCALTGDSDTFRDAKNLACWCKKNSSSDNRYVGTDNISCQNTCTNFIDFNQRKCLAANPSSTLYQTDSGGKQLICTSTYVTNIQGNDCISKASCSLLNLKGDRCVLTCDQGVPNTAGTQCECPTGFFQTTLSTQLSQCVTQCPTSQQYINSTGKQCTASCDTTTEQPNAPYNDKCVCKSSYYLTSTGCVACTTNAADLTTSTVYINIKGDQCITKTTGVAYICPDGTSLSKLGTGSSITYQCKCKNGYFINLTEDNCVQLCPSPSQVYNKELDACVISNCDLFQKSIWGNIDKTKCLLCAKGYGVQDGLCVLNTNTGSIANCRQYTKTSAAGVTPATYKCLLCYCDFALNSDGSQCVSNQVLGVQGCHQYDKYNICLMCRATFYGEYMPLNYPTNQQYEQNYLIVDLGLRPSNYLNNGFIKECIDNTWSDASSSNVVACREYATDGKTCSICHQDMQPFSVDNGTTKTCLKRKFYNPELCKKYKYVNGNSGTTTTDGGTASGSPIDYKWCQCDTTTYINYPQPLKQDSRKIQEDRYYYYPYDLENFPTQTQAYNGCVTFIQDCLLYDITPWLTNSKDLVTQCKRCLFGKILTYDRKLCVSSSALYCNWAANPDSVISDINSCHSSGCQAGLNYISVKGIDSIVNNQCGSINYCTEQISTAISSSTLFSFTLDTCKTCRIYYKLTTDGTKKYCVYYKLGTNYQGLKDDSTCDIRLGYTLTPALSICNCATTTNQKLSYPDTFPSTVFTPVQTPTASAGTSADIPNYVRAPVNLGLCRNTPSSTCADPYDASSSADGYTGKCKRCITSTTSPYWRSAAWNCLATAALSSTDGTWTNCEEIITGYGQVWCNQCQKDYGIIFGINLQVSTATQNFVNNGQCTNSANEPTQYIKNCIAYKQDSTKPGFPSYASSTNLQCLKCRDGYKVSGTTCVLDEDFGCDYFYQFYTTDTTYGYNGNSLCECKSGKTVIYSSFSYASAAGIIPVRNAACVDSAANVLKNCWLYTATATAINKVCSKCVTGQEPSGDCAIPAVADTTTAVAADYTKCVTFYGRLWIDYGTGATTTTDTTDKVYDFQWESATKPCKLLTADTTTNVLQGILYCGKYKDTTSCTQCKDGFQPYKSSTGAITSCVPVIKGCLIFNTFSTTYKCVRCLPSFTEVFINGNTNDIKGIYCDDPNDMFVIIQESTSSTSITQDQEPHPGCLKVTSSMEVDFSAYPVYESTPADFYTRNCNVCRDPYHLGFVGTKVTTKDGISDKIGCLLNNIEHCFSYDSTPTTTINGYTSSRQNFGQCNACYQPFRLWKNPADNTYYCIQEGCKTPTITSGKVLIDNCAVCDNDSQTQPYYKSNNVCKRHTLYISNCIKYSDTTNQICLTCDTANEYFLVAAKNSCIQCKQTDKNYYNESESGTACTSWTSNLSLCGRQTRKDRCDTCISDQAYSSNSYPVYSDTTAQRYIVKCIAASNNCAEAIFVDATTYSCVRCFSSDLDSTITSNYGFAQDKNPQSCINNSSNQANCYIYQTGSTTICKQCFQTVTNPNDPSKYYGITLDSSSNYVDCHIDTSLAPFCSQWLGVKAAGATTYTYTCQSCDNNYAEYIRDNTCIKGCKRAYAMKFCAVCQQGFALAQKNSFSTSCIWNYDNSFLTTTTNRVRYCAQYNDVITESTANSDITPSTVTTANLKCQLCKPGYVLVSQTITNKNIQCVKQYGSCNLDGCFILHDTFANKKIDSGLYANAEMLRCDKTTSSTNIVLNGGQLQNTVYSRNQYGCMINSTDATTKISKQYQLNMITRKCDYYLYNDGDTLPSSPNDGSQTAFGVTDLNCKGSQYDGGIAPPPYVPPTPSSTTSSSTTPSSTTSSKASFAQLFNNQLLQLLLICLALFAIIL